MLRMRVLAAASARWARSAPWVMLPGLDHMAEEAQVGQVELHGVPSSASAKAGKNYYKLRRRQA